MFRRRESPAPGLRQETPASQAKGAQMPSSPQSAAEGSGLSQWDPDIKTKGGWPTGADAAQRAIMFLKDLSM